MNKIKIEFGHEEKENPVGAWEGIGIKNGLLLVEAEYLGAAYFNDTQFIAANVNKDDYNKYPELLGKIIIREALVDMFADGSTTLFLNQEETETTRFLQNIVNCPGIRGKINNMNDLVSFHEDIYCANKSFEYIVYNNNVIATSIREDIFKKKNALLSKNHSSFCSLLDENSSLRNIQR
ncbi:MAG: hypothetical protein R3Y13_01510 [bacterium]